MNFAIRIATVAMLLPGVEAQTEAAAEAPHARRYRVKVGDCHVTAIARAGDGGQRSGFSGSPENAFLVERGGRSVLVAPVAIDAFDRESLVSQQKSSLDAVVVTSLDTTQPAGLMDGNGPAFPNSTVFIDRALLDGAPAKGARFANAKPFLATYRAIGRLRVVEPGDNPIAGVRTAISPYRALSESRVVIGCGVVTLMVLPAREVTFANSGAGTQRRDPRLARMLSSDAYVVALPDGVFPGIGSVYAEHDGFHWGSIAARRFDGVARRRGEVFVEPSDADGQRLATSPGSARECPKSSAITQKCTSPTAPVGRR